MTLESTFADLLFFVGSVDPTIVPKLVAAQQKGNHNARWLWATLPAGAILPDTDLRVKAQRQALLTHANVNYGAAAVLQDYEAAIFIGTTSSSDAGTFVSFRTQAGASIYQPRNQNQQWFGIANFLGGGAGVVQYRYDGMIFGYNP